MQDETGEKWRQGFPETKIVEMPSSAELKDTTMNLNEITYSIKVEEENNIPVRGNAIASGDEDFDKECEDKILLDIDNGNIWAWACVTVTANYRGLEGTEYLGACSYKNEADFCQEGGYYHQMKEEALNDLRQQYNDITA